MSGYFVKYVQTYQKFTKSPKGEKKKDSINWMIKGML